MAEKELFGGIEPTWRVAVAAEFCRIEEVCARAARAQWETVRIWRFINLGLGASAVVSAGVAGSVVLAGDRFPVIAGGLALVAAMLTTVISMVGPARKESQAVEAAKAYQSAETAARQSRQVDLPGLTFAQARQSLGELTDRWHAANRTATPVPRWAQRRAGRGTYDDRTEEILTDRVSEVVRVFRAPRRAVDQVS
ncbi:hypothetical protein GCM10023191_007410 [Actinoallomurus oryzae]|jgi:hypothetical protein|uniref:SLATT domain-containing protein n=1 Tax=Actinoallomurus oryzae TaxID=502180 RepID=A0ABP8PDF7_9ACTN|nr:hypothetical protein [Actinoallomurus sp. NBC_01490]